MKDIKDQKKLEIWGGIESTINRVDNNYYEQLRKSGHLSRISDLQLFADLGINKIRYPVLWEMVAPHGIKNADWSWTDERLNKLKELGITPIAGLLHHGSGPEYTSLIDPDFPQKLAEYAYAVAERYPWLQYFTPVNEPLTTARFSGLYGYWYPHGRGNNTFSEALLNQCKGTILSMQAIKQTTPSAKHVSTEDLGKTHSTKKLQYQAYFENERRWASYDLLTGKFHPDLPFFKYLLNARAIKEQELTFFTDNKVVPDILGINHYITSERYLDHRIEKYPFSDPGGNGKDKYVDVEVVRVAPHLRMGHYHLLKEVYDRYQLPLALTEVHLGCTREEQLRWLKEAYEASCQLKLEGLDIAGITAWSLLGAYDWNSLLVKDNHHYEPGVFDLSSGTPRPTAIAKYIEKLVQGKEDEHPVLKNKGWWQRPESILYPDDPELGGKNFCEVGIKLKSCPFSKSVDPLLITGGTGTLGKAFAKICDHRAIPFVLLNRKDLDISNPDNVNKIITKYKPWAIINTAGFVRVDEAEQKQESCFRENTHGPIHLARYCKEMNVQLLTISSDLVFNGEKRAPYVESDIPDPLSTYGQSKATAEKEVLKINPSALVLRTSAFFGPWDEYNFLTIMMNTIRHGNIFKATKDYIISPTYVPDLVNAALDLLIDQEKGIWHLANEGAISWADFAIKTAEMAQLDTSKIQLLQEYELDYLAPRPVYSVLGSEKGRLLPSLENAINRYLREVLHEIPVEV